MTEKLIEMKCIPCRGGAPPVTDEELAAYLPQIPEWAVVDIENVPCLQRVFTFKNFVQALAFANQVGAMAEMNKHHPAMLVEWGRVMILWWTHAIDNIHQNDLISAALTDEFYED